MSLQLLATESASAGFNPIVGMILLPIVGALIITLIPRSRPDAVRTVATTFAAMSGALSVQMLLAFKTHDGGFQFVIDSPWVKAMGMSWHFGVDGISLFMVVLSGLLFPLAIVAIKPDHDPKAYYGWLLVLMTGSIGVFMALDLVVFFLFFEIVLVPMYFLIGLWGHGDRTYAAMKFFLFTMAGSALMLVGILATAVLHQRGSGGALTFDVVRIATDQSISYGASKWIFGAFALAFAVKVPLFPLHTWLPNAHTEAPTAGSVILAGVMLKMGTYGFIRFGLYLFPKAAHTFAPVLLTLGVIGIVYGAIAATMQKDLKGVIAYSSIAHLGFIVIGIFSLTTQGIDGGVLQMVNHGITTPALFMLVGMIYERRHTRMISELSGLQKAAPIMAGVFTLAMLSSVGLPGLNGFPGEFLALLGTFKGARWWGVVAASGVILAALYLLWAYQRVFHGPAKGENATMRDLTLAEGLSLLPLCVAMVVFGVYPKPILDRVEPAVVELVHHMGAHDSSIDVKDVKAPAVAAEAAQSGEEGK